MKKIMMVLVMVGLIAPFVAGQTVKIYPSHDAYVDEYYSTTNYNNQNLKAGYLDYLFSSKGRQRSYFQFDLSSIQGTITGAVLSIDPLGGPVGSLNLDINYVSNDLWNEYTLTWNNAPSYSTLVDSQPALGSDRIEFDVGSVIDEQDNILSLVMKAQQEVENNHMQFFSSEFEAGGSSNEDALYWPYLEIETDGQVPECETVADTDCNECIDLLEYNNFKYGFKNGLLPEVELTEYNDIKYGFKNSLLNTC